MDYAFILHYFSCTSLGWAAIGCVEWQLYFVERQLVVLSGNCIAALHLRRILNSTVWNGGIANAAERGIVQDSGIANAAERGIV